ncbi:hypothetical protein NDU88_006997 [Pleurodeles waltl]|uniref:Helix-turn-helix domain-containing protein n=1 Tax=Pleurodeles waltl TaxID=8319 RepID=A0AAV7N565_PLEWA|nr:hypothetical protein NDU88_006997 [Pleurodeles waltl]
MSDLQGLSFDDSMVQAILQTPSILGDESSGPSCGTKEDWTKLSALKKELIKTVLHGTIMTEYLRANISPNGLIVTNVPRIFLQDLQFRLDWSQISWKCTRDWLILIINTSKRLADSITIQISITEAAMKTTVQLAQFKSRLTEINTELNETKEYLTRQKINKLQKDTKRFNREKVYLYTKGDFQCEVPSDTSDDSDTPQRRARTPQYSSSSDDWSDDEGQRTNRNRYIPPLLCTMSFTPTPLKVKGSDRLWRRYIDDILVIWKGNEDQATAFTQWVNTLDTHLRFSSTISDKEVSFLDLRIILRDGYLHSSVFHKHTDRNSLLLYNSHHPKALRDNLPFGQFLRIRRNCSDKNDFRIQDNALCRKLGERNYPERNIRQAKKRASNIPRETLLTTNTRTQQSRLTCVTTFTPLSNRIKGIVRRLWPILTSAGETLECPLFAFKRTHNIKDLVVHTRPTTYLPVNGSK